MSEGARPGKRTVLIGITVLLLAAQILPVSLLDGTDVSRFKRKHDPFSRQVDVPPEYMANYLLGNLFGGFKQVAINVLWVKYARLQDRQEYQEAVAILEALKVLQPRREEVWEHLTWDLSFNLSNRQPTADREWDMIKQGIGLVQEGVTRMPSSSRICQTASRIYHRRIPQELFMMKEVWRETGGANTGTHVPEVLVENTSIRRGRPVTNYRIALEYLELGRQRAKKQGKLDEYTSWYGFIITSSFYDVMTLARYGEHQRALDRIKPVRTLLENRFEDLGGMENTPPTFRVRYRSYEDLAPLLRMDRRLVSIPWSTPKERRTNRSKMIEVTRRYLERWGRFFRKYNYALAGEAARLVLRRSFRLSKYVAEDIEQYYRTGKNAPLERARTLHRETMGPLISRLIPESGNPGAGHLEQAKEDLGTYWTTMNDYFRFVRDFRTAENPEQRESAARKLEGVYTDVHRLYHSDQGGFHRPWFKDYLERLEEILKL